MVYIADGKSDVPVFSVMKQYSGRTFAVYDPSKPDSFAEANDLLKQGRVDCIGPADYTSGTQAYYWISDAVRDIAERIVANRQAILDERIARAPSHQGEADFAKTTVVTQEDLVTELKSQQRESSAAPAEPVSAPSTEQQPLISIPTPAAPPHQVKDDQEALIAACERVSDRYKPITKEEMNRLVVLIRNRAAARSEGGRRRGNARDLMQITTREVEAHLDQMRSTTL
jgi:hypothetical protein